MKTKVCINTTFDARWLASLYEFFKMRNQHPETFGRLAQMAVEYAVWASGMSPSEITYEKAFDTLSAIGTDHVVRRTTRHK